MSIPHSLTLTGLTPGEAITDTIYRAVAAYDTNSYPLLTSALHPDITFTIDTHTMTGLSTIKAGNFDLVGAMDTTHTISNVRVDVEGEGDRATAWCNALAQHYPAGTGREGERRLLVGARYVLGLIKEKEDGLWRIKEWVLEVVWKEGDDSVFRRETW